LVITLAKNHSSFWSGAEHLFLSRPAIATPFLESDRPH
jgi:hypothetical protein